MKWKIVGCLVGAFVMSGSLAKADSLTGTLETVNPGEYVTVSGSSDWAGQLVWDESGGGTFSTYCTQLYTDVYQYSTVTYDIVPLNQVPDISTTAAPTTEAGMIEDVIGSAPAGTNDQAAAVQVAIWKIIYDYSSTNSNWASSTTGTVKWDATSTWGSEAVTDLGYALSPTSPVGVVGLESNVQNQAWQQPMIGGGPISMGGIGGPIVPEPTVLLSVLSLAGLVGVNKARKLLSK